MSHFAFVLPDLGGGGAERVAIHLVEAMVASGHKVDIVVLRRGGALEALLPECVTFIDLAAKRVRGAILPLREYLRSRRPQAMLVFMWPLTVAAVLARTLAGTETRLVLADHNTLSEQYGRLMHPLIRASVRACYPRADERVLVSEGAANDFSNLTGLRREQLQVILNPVAPPTGSMLEAYGTAVWRPTGKRILTVGTLKTQKNHALLLEAFSLLATEDEVQLLILGDGPLSETLRQQADSLGIADRVTFAGFQLDTMPYYSSADLFVLTSDFEGLPLVLVEALHAGLPIVSTDCPNGPREILADGCFGTLVPVRDKFALAGAMRRALNEPCRPDHQKRRAADFAVDRAARAYEHLMLGRQ